MGFIVFLRKGIILRQERVRGTKLTQTPRPSMKLWMSPSDGLLVPPCRLLLVVLVGVGHSEGMSKNEEKLHCSLQGLCRFGRASRKCWPRTFTLARELHRPQ